MEAIPSSKARLRQLEKEVEFYRRLCQIEERIQLFNKMIAGKVQSSRVIWACPDFSVWASRSPSWRPNWRVKKRMDGVCFGFLSFAWFVILFRWREPRCLPNRKS